MKRKYLYITISVIAIFFVIYLFIGLTKPKTGKSTFLNTIPLFNQKLSETSKENTIYEATHTPPQVNTNKITSQVDSNLSQEEKDKIVGGLPVRIENFKTSTPLSTTINLFTLPSDPVSSLRLEIYGINFNNVSVKSEDAIAFKDSFIEIKKTLLSRKINLRNVQFIYGNRQYIQDTATNWVNYFKLLD